MNFLKQNFQTTCIHAKNMSNMASVQAWKLFFLCLLLPLSGWMFLTFTFLTEKTRDILPIKHYIALCFNTAIFKRLNINLWNLNFFFLPYRLFRFSFRFLLFFNFALDWFSFQHLILKLWGFEIRKLLLFIKKLPLRLPLYHRDVDCMQ